MSTAVEATAATQESSIEFARRGRWIDRWEPEDERFWDGGGRRIART